MTTATGCLQMTGLGCTLRRVQKLWHDINQREFPHKPILYKEAMSEINNTNTIQYAGIRLRRVAASNRQSLLLHTPYPPSDEQLWHENLRT